VYQEGLLEHPAIPGLWLTRTERVYGALLEYTVGGIMKTESVQEKVFRVKWDKPIPQTVTKTSGDFTTMNNRLFANVDTNKGNEYG
jgi:hypothetical protein